MPRKIKPFSSKTKTKKNKHLSWTQKARARIQQEENKTKARLQIASNIAFQKVFQNPHLLSRIIEQSDSPFITAKNLRTFNKASRQASIISQQGQPLKQFTAQDLLDAFSEDPQTRNNSPLGNYLQNAPKGSPLPDIDITLSPKYLNNNDILSALRNLQSSNTTSPVKAVIEVPPSELQSFINTQLPFLQENPSLFRAISIKNVSTQQLQDEITPLAQLLQYTAGTQITPTIKQFPLRISLTILTINEFLTTDFSTLPKNLQISQLTIDHGREPWLIDTLTNAQSSQFQQQLNNLKHATTLKLKIEITSDVTLTIPPSVTTLSTGNIDGTLQFAPGSQCSSLSLGFIHSSATTIPSSVTTLTAGDISGTLQFAPDSQCSSLSIGYIHSTATVTIPSSVTTLTAGAIRSTLLFAPGSQCTSLSLGSIGDSCSVIIPPSVKKLTTGYISGTLLFAPGSQSSELSLRFLFLKATVTIPSSVKILTINKTPYTGQKLLDLKSGKTSHKNVTFEQQ